MDKDNLTPLFLAATKQGDGDTLQEFLRHPKSDYKHVDRNGNTLFHYAAHSYYAIPQFLQECVGLGMDINAQNNKGATAVRRNKREGREGNALSLRKTNDFLFLFVFFPFLFFHFLSFFLFPLSPSFLFTAPSSSQQRVRTTLIIL